MERLSRRREKESNIKEQLIHQLVQSPIFLTIWCLWLNITPSSFVRKRSPKKDRTLNPKKLKYKHIKRSAQISSTKQKALPTRNRKFKPRILLNNKLRRPYTWYLRRRDRRDCRPIAPAARRTNPVTTPCSSAGQERRRDGIIRQQIRHHGW